MPWPTIRGEEISVSEREQVIECFCRPCSRFDHYRLSWSRPLSRAISSPFILSLVAFFFILFITAFFVFPAFGAHVDTREPILWLSTLSRSYILTYKGPNDASLLSHVLLLLLLVAHNGGEANRRRILREHDIPADEISRDIAPTFQPTVSSRPRRGRWPEASRTTWKVTVRRSWTRSKRRVPVVGFVRETVPHSGKNEEARDAWEIDNKCIPWEFSETF